MRSENAFLVGSGVRFGCRTGYKLLGERRLVCLQDERGIGAAQWSNRSPRCVPRAKRSTEGKFSKNNFPYERELIFLCRG